MSSEFFQVSLTVYAIVATVFFITSEVIIILIFLRIKAIFLKMEQITDLAVNIEQAIINKIESVDVINSIRRFIEKFRRKE